MSAKRYSGDATVTVSIDDESRRYQPGRQSYRYVITQGRNRSEGYISAPITMAVDSPTMFDEVASGALAFATHDKEIDDDTLDFGDEGYVVSRRKR